MNLFEELMKSGRKITEAAGREVVEENAARKISAKKIRVESLRIFEDADVDALAEIDAQFDVTPEDTDRGTDEVVLVIDPEIPAEDEIPEDAAEHLVGSEVYKCPVCGANYACNCDSVNESVEVDENGVPVECPICGDDAEQILVGEIAPVEDAGEEGHFDPVDGDDVEVVDPVVDAELTEDIDISVETNDEGNVTEVTVEDDGEEVIDAEVEEVSEDADEEGLEEDLDVIVDPVDDTSEDTEDADLVLEPVCPGCGEVEETPEEPVVGIDADVVNLVLDDRRLESMMTKVIRENYNNTSATFKMTRCSIRKGNLVVEYVVRDGKKSRKGVLVSEGFDPSKRAITLNFKDKGVFTESYAKKPSFVVECVKLRNSIIPTKMTYDYRVKVNESLYAVEGTVSARK